MQIDLSFLVIGVYWFLRALSFLIVARIIISWVAPHSTHPVVIFVLRTTEQVISPIRSRLPRGEGMVAMVDWAPLVALILIDLIRYALVSVFVGVSLCC
ncbi:MAG: YggT family protein [Candidatus Gracilibacteria bacterium]|nr:YggT family protein [Candidatus Gracilibacteria bacterium]